MQQQNLIHRVTENKVAVFFEVAALAKLLAKIGAILQCIGLPL